VRRKLLCAIGVWLAAVVQIVGAHRPDVRASTQPSQSPPSDRTYQARRATTPITIDGHADEPSWAHAAVERNFVFPWTHARARTEFRALWDDRSLYFTFRVQDADLVVLDRLRDEQDAVFEDRVEIFFSRDEQMKDYYCVEIDSRGRVYDYRGAFYRRFDPAWHLEGLEVRGSTRPGGYEIEGRIPLMRLSEFGLSAVRPGAKLRWGLYRAEFSHDRSGRAAQQRPSLHTLGRESEGPPPIEDWASWIDPHTKEPDFHVPASLGWLAFVE
jgi:hypothetical protein